MHRDIDYNQGWDGVSLVEVTMVSSDNNGVVGGRVLVIVPLHLISWLLVYGTSSW